MTDRDCKDRSEHIGTASELGPRCILFHVNPRMVSEGLSDEMLHLAPEGAALYWETTDNPKKLTCPTFGFMHFSGTGRVSHWASIQRIEKSSNEDVRKHYEDKTFATQFKPASERWRYEPDRNWKAEYVITTIVRCDYEWNDFKDYDTGGGVKPGAGFRYVRLPQEMLDEWQKRGNIGQS